MSYKVWVGYEMGIKENGLLLQPGPANVLNNGQTILAQIYIYIYISLMQLYIYIYINSRTAPIKLPLIAHGHVPLIYYLLSKGIVGTSNMLILDFWTWPAWVACAQSQLYVNALQLNELSALRNTFPWPRIQVYYVCMYVCISQHLPRFQERPSKSRLFRSLSINSEREQTNTHYTNNVWSGKL